MKPNEEKLLARMKEKFPNLVGSRAVIISRYANQDEVALGIWRWWIFDPDNQVNGRIGGPETISRTLRAKKLVFNEYPWADIEVYPDY